MITVALVLYAVIATITAARVFYVACVQFDETPASGLTMAVFFGGLWPITVMVEGFYGLFGGFEK